MLEWGQHEKMLKKAAETRYVEALEKRPTLYSDLFQVWSGFNDLHCSRQIGMSVCPLQLQEIISWLDLNCITDSETRLDYVELIREMDLAWLKWNKDHANSSSSDRRKQSEIGRSNVCEGDRPHEERQQIG